MKLELELSFRILFRTDYGLRTGGRVEVTIMCSQLLDVAVLKLELSLATASPIPTSRRSKLQVIAAVLVGMASPTL